MKTCLKCGKGIDEEKEKYAMIITKVGNRIIQFDCFHFSCWKNYLEFNLRLLLGR